MKFWFRLLVSEPYFQYHLLVAGSCEAEPLQRRRLEASKRTLGEDHPDSQIAKADLSVTLSLSGREAEASDT